MEQHRRRCFLNFVWGERAAVHRLLYNTTTLERIHHRWPRHTTAYWKPNYRNSIGVYCRIDKTVYIPHTELCLCYLLTVSGLTNGLLQTRVHVHPANQRCPKKKLKKLASFHSNRSKTSLELRSKIISFLKNVSLVPNIESWSQE